MVELSALPVPGTGTASVLTGLLHVGPCRALEVRVQEASLVEREAKHINSKTSHFYFSGIGLDLDGFGLNPPHLVQSLQPLHQSSSESVGPKASQAPQKRAARQRSRTLGTSMYDYDIL